MAKLEENLAISLQSAGIGRRYHDLSLQSLGEVGKTLTEEIVSGEVRRKAREGATWLFYGTNALVGGTLFLRGCHLVGLRTRVLPLRELLRFIMKLDTEDSPINMEDVRVLGVTGFYDSAYKDDCPLRAYERQAVETFLTDLWADQCAMVLTSTSPMEECSWWSQSFLNLGSQNLIQIGVSK